MALIALLLVGCASVRLPAYEPAAHCNRERMTLPADYPHRWVETKYVRELEEANAACGAYHYETLMETRKRFCDWTCQLKIYLRGAGAGAAAALLAVAAVAL
ncbi:MAG: hypothetical protein KDG50_03250 [Chromatiales bacterium]|nr:hypothetical protein [Chromatiales bacterium]